VDGGAAGTGRAAACVILVDAAAAYTILVDA